MGGLHAGRVTMRNLNVLLQLNLRAIIISCRDKLNCQRFNGDKSPPIRAVKGRLLAWRCGMVS